MVKVDFVPLIQGYLEGTLYILTKIFCYKFYWSQTVEEHGTAQLPKEK